MRNARYGYCEKCNIALQPICFKEQEYDGYGMKTGRVRTAVSHLVCPLCLESYIVDDSFDEEWIYI